MYVAWVDLERTGNLKPVPCKEIKSFNSLDEGMIELLEVEQIRDPARPSMTVNRIIMRREDIRYIVVGVDPADADDILNALPPERTEESTEEPLEAETTETENEI